MSSQLSSPTERGHVMIVAVLVTVMLAVFGFSMVEAVTSAKEEGAANGAHQQRLFLAESGLDAATLDMRAGGSGALGSATAPIALGSGTFYTLAYDRGNGTTTVFSVGRYQGGERVLRTRFRRARPVFGHAIFAGNSSGDRDYVMKFGGTGAHADEIHGDIYSGGGILVEQQASIDGTTRAQGAIVGTTGETSQVQAGFDFSGVDWTQPGIVDVAAEFAKGGVTRSGTPGGKAGELPATNPAHIFRLNPDDRSGEVGGTPKNDYFLEDPYEPMGVDKKDDGSDPYMLSIDDGSGTARRTYYIDGNLWLHNDTSMSFMLKSAGATGTQVTFIVRGNITFSDSFRLQNPDLDAVGFVALKDPAVPGTGNIYMGDPAFGTLKELQAFLYAENDFLDINLDANGSKAVHLLGAMTAGNQVAIERTYKGGHSKLTVDWDQRLLTGAASLPFLSTDMPSAGTQVLLEAWVESPIVPLAGVPPTGSAAPVEAPLPEPSPAELAVPEPGPETVIPDGWWTPPGQDWIADTKAKKVKSVKVPKPKSIKVPKVKSVKGPKLKSVKGPKLKSVKKSRWK